MTRVRLTRKLADVIDGVDLTGCTVGDTVDLAPRDAFLLLSEGWALPERRSERRGPGTHDASGASHNEQAPALGADKGCGQSAPRRKR